MLRHVVANAQTGLEAVRWLREDADINRGVLDTARTDGVPEVAMLAIRDIAKFLPGLDIKRIFPAMLRDEFEYLGIGAESIAVKDGDKVRKYLTGKTPTSPGASASPQKLAHYY